jgi:hypothetical protein
MLVGFLEHSHPNLAFLNFHLHLLSSYATVVAIPLGPLLYVVYRGPFLFTSSSPSNAETT